MNYKIVVSLLFPNGNEEYVIWEPMLYGDMIDRRVDFYSLFYQSPELVKNPPLEVSIFLYSNPSVTNTSLGQMLVGKKICLIATI
jgi:hypothetical protein